MIQFILVLVDLSGLGHNFFVALDIYDQRSLCLCMSTSRYEIITVSIESIHLKSPASQTEAKLLGNLREMSFSSFSEY